MSGRRKSSKASTSKKPRTKLASGSSSLRHLASLQHLAKKKNEQYLYSENTTNSYEGQVKRAKEFLATFFEAERGAEAEWKGGDSPKMWGVGEEAIAASKDLSDDPELPRAFNDPPVKCTPLAITMFLAYKCFEEDRGLSTADSIHAAFIRYYNQIGVLLLGNAL
jgi:hypothetical protein